MGISPEIAQRVPWDRIMSDYNFMMMEEKVQNMPKPQMET